MRLVASLLFTFVALLGCSADGPIWMPVSDKASPLFRIVVNGRAGFIDPTGRVVVAPTLPVLGNWGQVFRDGLLSLKVVGAPFINSQGQKVLTSGFAQTSDFSEGLALARTSDRSKWGFIDLAGNFVIPPQFPSYPDASIGHFSEGLAAIEISGKAGYIDRTGTFVIPRQFAAALPFRDGVARVVTDGGCAYFPYDHIDPCASFIGVPRTGIERERNGGGGTFCKWQFIDKTGKVVINGSFEGAMDFYDGLAAVKVGKLWGFIDRRGTFVIRPAFREAHSFSDGLALVDGDNKVGFIDNTGALKIRVAFAEPFSEGLAVVKSQRGYSYINTEGKRVIPESFALASRFFHGLAHVRLIDGTASRGEGNFAYIDKTGKHVFNYRR